MTICEPLLGKMEKQEECDFMMMVNLLHIQFVVRTSLVELN